MIKQFLDREQMTHLQELGLNTDKASVLVGKYYEVQRESWYRSESFNACIIANPSDYGEEQNDLEQFDCDYKAFTLQDLLTIMPKHIDFYELNWHISDMIFRYDYTFGNGGFTVLEGLSYSFNENVQMIDVAYDMLCKLIEKGYLKL